MERYEDMGELYVEKVFDSTRFYQECTKREPAGLMTSAEAAEKADPMQWNYTTPDGYTVDEMGRWTVDGVVQTKEVEIVVPETYAPAELTFHK